MHCRAFQSPVITFLMYSKIFVYAHCFSHQCTVCIFKALQTNWMHFICVYESLSTFLPIIITNWQYVCQKPVSVCYKTGSNKRETCPWNGCTSCWESPLETITVMLIFSLFYQSTILPCQKRLAFLLSFL